MAECKHEWRLRVVEQDDDTGDSWKVWAKVCIKCDDKQFIGLTGSLIDEAREAMEEANAMS